MLSIKSPEVEKARKALLEGKNVFVRYVGEWTPTECNRRLLKVRHYRGRDRILTQTPNQPRASWSPWNMHDTFIISEPFGRTVDRMTFGQFYIETKEVLNVKHYWADPFVVIGQHPGLMTLMLKLYEGTKDHEHAADEINTAWNTWTNNRLMEEGV